MLSLDDPRWSELQHAYGAATDIPSLLGQLSTLPSTKGDAEPWASLWSSLAHQGDVYSASFAAVPHVIAALETDPLNADWSYFGFPAWVECSRARGNVPIPNDLDLAYRRALSKLPKLVGEASKRPWDEEFLLQALAAIAVAKGQPAIAEAVMELNSETAERFLRSVYEP